MKWVLLLMFVGMVSAGTVVRHTASGPVKGIASPEAFSFYGIPYAASTAEEARWTKPAPRPVWHDTFDATDPAVPGCPQHCELPALGCPKTYTEDCLTLTIFTPSTANVSSRLPVMVYFPGGHFEQGGAGTPLYDGQTMVNRSDIILVVSSYRLGVLGWLIDGPNITGNYGLMDQQFALTWVRDNIGEFGGDSSRVTIFGQSAGGASVAAHLISEQSDALFHRAIMQSACTGIIDMNPKNGHALGALFSKAVSCADGDIDCMRKSSVDTLLDGQYAVQEHVFLSRPVVTFLPWNINVDNVLIKQNMLDAFISGEGFQKKPVMVGSVSDEGIIFLYQAAPKGLPPLEYKAVVYGIFGLKNGPRVLEFFPAMAGDSRPAISNLATEYIFACPFRASIRGLVRGGIDETYLYQFRHAWSFAEAGWGENYTYCWGKSCHSSELPYIFSDHGKESFNITFTDGEVHLAHKMMAYWSNFAHTGNPNMGPSPVEVVWPRYSPTIDPYLSMDVPNFEEMSGLDSTVCDFFDSIGYHHGDGLREAMQSL